ncbi:hypothetical protein DFQ01_102102 [Paenibacillus cellulosilyticus]|uniref:Uncharacterized protein n=1 Tax=Paenibacillus cellulosilyticus TaxID=375489 RepID=A0A2V2YYJ3_9BACL|nr:DUF5696 domain-containing protein [Paenibacillus cellulosilyticus]PWW07210.1 hypothetical protein DFQ01_102102 [Paenibacillus cellulosilyticus]QKS44593.1 hypothetical protein HUB94_09340 [Paenibacillus cellulosilyticus]
MSMARNALLCLTLLVGLVLAGCSGSQTAAQNDEMEQYVAAFKSGSQLSNTFSDNRVAGMKGISQNDRLALFVDDQTGTIAVMNKQSGEIWYSNPAERDKDSTAQGVNKALLSAQLNIEYYNNFGQSNTINTFTDSVSYKQVKYESIDNGIKVTYEFGTAKKSAADLPLMLSEARFKELSDKLDKTGKRALGIAYKENADKGTYDRNDSALNGLQLDRAFKAFEDAGYTEEDLEKDMQELGFTQDKVVPRIFFASIEYTLDGDSLIVKVPQADIHAPSAYPIATISLLSFFGAGGKDEQGSLFVPDGSGSLIHFNNGKTQYPAYQQLVYGDDLTTKTVEDASYEQAVRLPVFGIIKNHGALLGIIEEGAAVAAVNADISGKLNGYNYVYPSFTLTNKGLVTLTANSQERTLPHFQEDPLKTDLTVRYAFLNGSDASYSGMAKYYQQYLEKHDGLPAKQTEAKETKETKSEAVPFYLQLVGSIAKDKHFIGIPYTSLESLTTFKQAQDMISQVQARDIANIKLKYAGWFNGGLDHKVPDHISVDDAVGGSKGLKSLVAYAQEHGVSLFPDVAVLEASTGSDFDEKSNASRTLRGVVAELYPLDMALNRRDRNKSPSYVVSPSIVGDYVNDIVNGMKSYQTGGISLRDLGSQLNSDYRKSKQVDRDESENISASALNTIRQNGMSIMAQGGNAYALPFLSDITDAPMSNSSFKLEDEEIPFYQMVIRGYINYTGTPYNLTSYTDERQYILKSLEYGSGVYFEWIYEPNYKVKDTENNGLYAVNYELWMDKAADIYHEVNDVLKHVANQPIASHEKLSEGVYKTVYANGVYVIVNYNGSQVEVDGKLLEAESYMTGGAQS